MKKVIAISILIIFCQSNNCFAQKIKVNQDVVKVVCPDVPRQQRPRVTVPRFNMTAPNAPRDQFGDNLATMLTNALQQVNCYNVIASIKDSSDLLNAQSFQEQHGSKSHRVKSNNFSNPNVIIVGEIIKYEVSMKSFGITLIHTRKNTADIGINITLKDAETGEIIDSRQFSATKKIMGATNIGVGIPYLGRVDIASSAMSNPAVQQATEDAINQAVVFISSERDKMPMPGNSSQGGGEQSIVTIQNISYEHLNTLTSALEKITGVVSVDSDDYADNIANIKINHSLKSNDLINRILQVKSGGLRLTVKSKTKDGVVLVASN